MQKYKRKLIKEKDMQNLHKMWRNKKHILQTSEF